MAKHLKSIVLPKTIETYVVKPMFNDISNDENIREGVLAFRAFLHRLCDALIAECDSYNIPTKTNVEHGSAIYCDFPFLDNIKKILLHIGLNGDLTKDAQLLISGNSITDIKLSNVKIIQCMKFLTGCGLFFDGINLDIKRQKISEIETIYISYPDNTAMLVGLKTMALAELRLGTTRNQNIFMRCDYRMLTDKDADVLTILNETIQPLSANVQDFVLRLHQIHLDYKLNCTVEIRGYWIKIKYSRGKKEVWGINTSLNNGFEITAKPLNTQKYTDTIIQFPLALQELITKGYGCGRKRAGIGKCDSGCEGIRLPLSDAILDISDSVETWFDKELSCFAKK